MSPRAVQAALIVGAYLLGAVPFGLLLAKLRGVDVREAGSGNIGATNVARSAGKLLGALTLLLDALKGAAPVLLGRHLGLGDLGMVSVALAAVLGHVFPIYLRFRGGKGVATALGVFLALTWKPTLIAIGSFALVFAVFRIVSLGSLVGAIALTASAWYLGEPTEVLVLAVVITGLVFVRHRGNIRRMLERREHGI